MTWYRDSEQVMLDRLCEEFAHMSGTAKMEMMLVDADVYFAVQRLVKYHEAAKRLAEKELRRRQDD